jgi:hypothetical protein
MGELFEESRLSVREVGKGGGAGDWKSGERRWKVGKVLEWGMREGGWSRGEREGHGEKVIGVQKVEAMGQDGKTWQRSKGCGEIDEDVGLRRNSLGAGADVRRGIGG